MDNLELWESVEKTNPSHTKEVTFGRKITAIDPYQQMKNATAKFGAVGIGWGWSVERVEYLPTNELALLIRMWHTSKENTFDQWGQASLYIDKKELKKDTDCFKKATTDGVTKCLSLIGFNADVFLGKFEDNKYVQELKDEFNKPELMKKEDVAFLRKGFNEVFTEVAFCGLWSLDKLEDLHQVSFDNAVKYIQDNKQ